MGKPFMNEMTLILDRGYDGEKADVGSYNRLVIDALAEDLKEVGIEVSECVEEKDGVSLAQIKFRYAPTELKQLRTRHAGRRRSTEIPEGSPLENLTCEEAFAWLQGHSEADCTKALGVSRAVFYRRKKEMAAYLKEDPSHAAESFEKAYRYSIEGAH